MIFFINYSFVLQLILKSPVFQNERTKSNPKKRNQLWRKEEKIKMKRQRMTTTTRSSRNSLGGFKLSTYQKAFYGAGYNIRVDNACVTVLDTFMCTICINVLTFLLI